MSYYWPSGPFQPSPDPRQRRPVQHRAATAPGPGGFYPPPLGSSLSRPPYPRAPSSIPPSLIPGQRPRGNSFNGQLPDNLMFVPRRHTESSASRHPPSAPDLRRPPVPRREARTTVPPLPPKEPLNKPHRHAPPVPPPKPSSSSRSPSFPVPRTRTPSYHPPVRQTISMPSLPIPAAHANPLPTPSEADEDKEMELALRLSAKESEEREQEVAHHEEHELAWALEESMKIDPSVYYVESPSSDDRFPGGPSSSQRASSSSTPWASPSLSSDPHPYSSFHSGFATAVSRRRETLPVSLPSFRQSQFWEDEALAHRLANAGGSSRPSLTRPSTQYAPPPGSPPVSTPPVPPSDPIPHRASGATTAPSSPVHHNGRPITLQVQKKPPAYIGAGSSPRSRSADVICVDALSSSSAARRSPRARPLAPSLSVSSTSTVSTVSEGGSGGSEGSSHASRSTTSNQYVEPELLCGVSWGFNPPVISASPEAMASLGPVPNIISLPYGKYPPMHLQAPSWRQLLKLMAKLSGTQIEPSVEAMAQTKGQLKLRTVVQFVKVHHSSSEWRTILYLSIDYPPPASDSAWKYSNGDVSVLPYSYFLSHPLALLSDGPDSPMAKYYTIPATATTPLPSLPISFPSMALYLASALDDSRRALHDTSSGTRKLAKMINQFYPADTVSPLAETDDGERHKAKALLGRMIGRSKPSGGRNADVYELVTPFVPEEWG